jgi:AraC-like DNA-binding protein
MFLPLVVLFSNKGYKRPNRYLAGFLFFASYYLLANFYFFFGKSLTLLALFSTTGSFFYLIGPFAFLYARSILKDNADLNKIDYLHFALFVVSFLGSIPYFFSDWEFKTAVARIIQSENWDTTSFKINWIIPDIMDQALNVLHTYFYAIGLWYLLWVYRKRFINRHVPSLHFTMIRRWLFFFVGIYSIIAINFAITMINIWVYDDKSLFLAKAETALILAGLIYVAMNMTLMVFPTILYGLPMEGLVNVVNLQPQPFFQDLKANDGFEVIAIENQETLPSQDELKLFTPDYISAIEQVILSSIAGKCFVNPEFKLTSFSLETGIPSHHLTYFFNNIKGISFSDWRNGLRVDHAKELIHRGDSDMLSLEGIAMNSGFSSQSTFIRAFKNGTGKTPSQYLKDHQAALAPEE